MKTYVLTARSSRIKSQVVVTATGVAPATPKEMMNLGTSLKEAQALYRKALTNQWPFNNGVITSTLCIKQVETVTKIVDHPIPNPRKTAIRVTSVSRPCRGFTRHKTLRLTFNTSDYSAALDRVFPILQEKLPEIMSDYDYCTVQKSDELRATSCVDLKFKLGTDLRAAATLIHDKMGGK